eukprot:g2061.t1
MFPAVEVEACTHHRPRRADGAAAGGGGGSSSSSSTHLGTRPRLAALLFIFCFCQWVFVKTVVPSFATGALDGATLLPTSSGRGIRAAGAGMATVGGNSSSGAESVGGGRVASEVVPEAARFSRRPPRILTVLTTYDQRSSFVKPYKEAVSGQGDGYQPTVFVASNEEDGDPDEVVDFKTGSWKQHRLLAAIAEACARHEGTFDWLAVGDDDTAFLYSRAAALLSHIDHSQPLAFGVVDGLNHNAAACPRRQCFSPERKRNASDFLEASGCCDDFTHPCEVPAFPESALPPQEGRNFSYADYGGGGLFWPFGGAGFFLSRGVVDVVGGEGGFRRCIEMFGHMNTDVQVAACLKFHGYSVGLYTEGFTAVRTSDPAQIQETLASDCQILGVHLGMRHLTDGSTYTPEAFGAAVAAVREVDSMSVAVRGDGDEVDLETSCPDALAQVSKYKKIDQLSEKP